MNALPGYDPWLSAPYDDVDQDAIDAAVDEIGANPDRVAELVIDHCGGNLHFADELTALAEASQLLARMAEGDTLSDLTADKQRGTDNAQAFRALLRAAERADKIVEGLILDAAMDQTS